MAVEKDKKGYKAAASSQPFYSLIKKQNKKNLLFVKKTEKYFFPQSFFPPHYQRHEN